MLGDDVAVVFFSGAAEGFEGDDKEDYADAGAGEGGLGFDAPGAGNEAWVGLVRLVGRLEAVGSEGQGRRCVTVGEDGFGSGAAIQFKSVFPGSQRV